MPNYRADGSGVAQRAGFVPAASLDRAGTERLYGFASRLAFRCPYLAYYSKAQTNSLVRDHLCSLARWRNCSIKAGSAERVQQIGLISDGFVHILYHIYHVCVCVKSSKAA